MHRIVKKSTKRPRAAQLGGTRPRSGMVVIRMGLMLSMVLSLVTVPAFGQLDTGLIQQLQPGTTTQINATTPLGEGSMVYNETTHRVMLYANGNWTEIGQAGPTTQFGTISVTGTGNISISGLPFTPSSVVFTAYANVDTVNLDADNGVGNNNSGINNSFGSMHGFAQKNGAGIQQQVIYNGGSGNSINDISRYASSSHCIGLRYSNQNGNSLGLTTATATSFTSTGFILNVDSHADNVVIVYQAFR